MEVPALVAKLVALLTPALPLLLQSDGTSTSPVLELLEPRQWQEAQALWERIGPVVAAKPELREAMGDVVASPEDEDAIPALRQQFKKLLTADAALAAALAQIIAPAASASGRSVTIGGDTTGSTVVTGDANQIGQVEHSGGTHNGPAVGLNLGTIIYRQPSDAELEHLRRYLSRVAGKLGQLRLGGLSRLDNKGLLLSHVYVLLATTELAHFQRGTAKVLAQFCQVGHDGRTITVKDDYDPQLQLPPQAIIRGDVGQNSHEIVLWRATLASEAVFNRQHLVLLGAPGSGKSTFVRHLAWALAERGLDRIDATTALYGWDDDERLLPVVLPLRKLAGQLATVGVHVATVSAALRDEMTIEYNSRNADTVLDKAVDQGAALLLFDGLDEVPIDAIPGNSVDRATTLRAVRDFAEVHPDVHVLVTCRSRAFSNDLQELLGWPAETIAPLTLGQIRHFVKHWFTELVERGSLDHDRAVALIEKLVATITADHDRLREMATTPLLLTMMAIVLYEKGELPRDRPRLYEAILQQLLGQWDEQRGGASLAQVIGDARITTDDLRPVLDALSFQAHSGATSQDGRGRLSARDLHIDITERLDKMGVVDAYRAATRCLVYFNERSGLLLPEDDGTQYAFAHLTIQEYCAGRHLLLGSKAAERVMELRTDDRWREPIVLGIGAIQTQYAPMSDRIENILNRLVSRSERGRPKVVTRWYLDLILAVEIGVERDWQLLGALIDVESIQDGLRTGLVTLLRDRDQLLSVAERVRAGFLLGGIGDPRFPVTLDDCRNELQQRNEQFGQPAGYWCYVRPGTYRIGGWEEDEPSADITLPPFWIAQFPITVAQYTPFVDGGYSDEAQRWWTPNGWQWKQEQQRTEPYFWGDKQYSTANQPVIGVTWYEAVAFTAWLSEQLQDVLPPDYVIRLPTEAEWEATAAYDTTMQRRLYPWGDEEPTTEYAIYEDAGFNNPVSVGCCVAGRASCGALDMAGNVWEWTASDYNRYPQESETPVSNPQTSGELSLCGGSYYNNRTYVRCGARGRDLPDNDIGNYGFRVVVAPRLRTNVLNTAS